MEKKTKKEIAEIEKIRKKLVAIKTKSINPLHCIRFLNIYVDDNLFNSESLFDLKDFMSIGKYNYKSKKQDIPYLITFVRDKLEINSKEDFNHIDQVISKIIHTPVKQFIVFVPPLSQSIFEDFPSLESYFKGCKELASNKGRVFLIINSAQEAKKNLSYQNYIEDLQINCPNIHVNVTKNHEDSLELLRCGIRAIAEIPYKKEIEKGEMAYMNCMTSAGTNGSEWKRILMCFKNVSSDMADAIIAVYPSLQSLYKAYKDQINQKDKELMLENIVIRRGSGLLNTSRRLGPELSTRIAIAFLSDVPSTPLY